jgi:hypothetical protein
MTNFQLHSELDFPQKTNNIATQPALLATATPPPYQTIARMFKPIGR